ncbi:helix-turn-helix domain-containing protein [Emergencia sp. 1XD21-10]|uniref:helix-turn-helix domain-containing protein n=1 Tax=Emergencia sp. 1XD21-10 TaxID=2304569 RepID=UPI00137B148B|nr:helix-turn-helix domain-containing protein [Emergencia sp. 1XD21-10]NCF00659.1 helix-turn-helix domain-containing protein [Emergencia sp. 1XD21-10]
MSRIWTESTRADLEFLLKEGYKVPKIAKMMGISPASIYNELKLTLTEEEYKDRRFTKYTADLAWQMERKSRSGKVEINEAAE